MSFHIKLIMFHLQIVENVDIKIFIWSRVFCQRLAACTTAVSLQ